MSDYPMLISNKLHSFRNFLYAKIRKATSSVAFRLSQMFSHLCNFAVNTCLEA